MSVEIDRRAALAAVAGLAAVASSETVSAAPAAPPLLQATAIDFQQLRAEGGDFYLITSSGQRGVARLKGDVEFKMRFFAICSAAAVARGKSVVDFGYTKYVELGDQSYFEGVATGVLRNV